MVSRASAELGSTSRLFSTVRRCTERQLTSNTRPRLSPTEIKSPTENGRSKNSAMPDIRLPRVSCSARPSTIEPTPSAATRPPRSWRHTTDSTMAAPMTTSSRRIRSWNSFGARLRQLSLAAFSNTTTLNTSSTAYTRLTHSAVSTRRTDTDSRSISSSLVRKINRTARGKTMFRSTRKIRTTGSVRRSARYIASPSSTTSSWNPRMRLMPQTNQSVASNSVTAGTCPQRCTLARYRAASPRVGPAFPGLWYRFPLILPRSFGSAVSQAAQRRTGSRPHPGRTCGGLPH